MNIVEAVTASLGVARRLCGLSARWFRRLSPIVRALVMRLGLLLLLCGGNKLFLDALASVGMRPLEIGLAGAALYILLLRGLLLLASDAQVAVAAWCGQEAQRLLASFARALDARGSGGRRVEDAPTLPPRSPTRPRGPRHDRTEVGPTCWACGGVNDGHGH